MSEEVLYDKRLIERHIRQGLITREAADKRMAQSGDMAERADSIDVEALVEELRTSTRRRPFPSAGAVEAPSIEPRDVDDDE